MDNEYKAWIWYMQQTARKNGDKLRRVHYYLVAITPEERAAFNNLLGDIEIDLEKEGE